MEYFSRWDNSYKYSEIYGVSQKEGDIVKEFLIFIKREFDPDLTTSSKYVYFYRIELGDVNLYSDDIGEDCTTSLRVYKYVKKIISKLYPTFVEKSIYVDGLPGKSIKTDGNYYLVDIYQFDILIYMYIKINE